MYPPEDGEYGLGTTYKKRLNVVEEYDSLKEVKEKYIVMSRPSIMPFTKPREKGFDGPVILSPYIRVNSLEEALDLLKRKRS